MDWSLYRCGRTGHITYAPDEAELRSQLHARTPSGDLWQCLRCGNYVTGQPDASGSASDAPAVRRGKEIRSEIILRLFAIERVLRFLLFGAAAYAIWQFRESRLSITQAFHHEFPLVREAFRDLGYNIDRSSVLGLFRHALRLSPTTLTLLAAALGAYAVIEAVEATGLWLAKRWGEYFAMVVTSLFLPYEIYDISAKFTWIRAGLFAVNLVLVLYLLITRRLFGLRGGKAAYEARLRSESVLDEAARAAAAGPRPGITSPADPSVTAAGPGATPGDPGIATAGPSVTVAGPPWAKADPPGAPGSAQDSPSTQPVPYD